MVLIIAINTHNMKILKSKGLGGHNAPLMFPNKTYSHRINENQKCDDEQFVEQKIIK